MDEKILLLKTAIIEENRENGREIVMAATIPVENRNGFVFGAAEARSRSVFAKTVTEIIVDRLTRLAVTLQDTTSPPRRFEQTLEAINEEIAARAAEMEVFSPSEFKAVIGLVIDQTLYISGTGELPSFFLHRLPEGRYQVFNLARSIQTEQAVNGWQKIFVVVLDGDLNPGDVFCASNQNLQRELQPEELHTLLATLPPQSAVQKLRQYFPLEISLSLFILQIGNENNGPAISAPASLKQLHEARQQTKQTLSDQKPSLTKITSWWLAPFIKNRRDWWRLGKTIWRLVFNSVKISVLILRDLIFGVFHLIKKLFSSERKDIIKKISESGRHSLAICRRTTKGIPKTSRYLILAAIIMIIIIIFSLFSISQGRQAREARAVFEAAITKVEDLRDAAESALIYKDEGKARSLLNQAEKSLTAINTEVPENLTRITEVKKEIQDTLNDLRRIIEITNPQIVNRATLNFLTEEATFKSQLTAATDQTWVDYYLYEDRVYLLSPSPGLASQIYRLNYSNNAFGTPTAWVKSPLSELSDTVSLAVDGTVFALRSNGKILRFVGGRDVAWSQSEIDPPITSASDIWTSADSKYLYVLEPTGQRLVVFEKENGLLVKQYYSSSFTGLSDFFVDETNKIIYLMGTEIVWKIEAEHIK